MTALLEVIANVAFVVAAIGALAFVVLYSLLAPWWRTWWGRHLFTFMLVVALILLLVAVRIIFGPYPGVQFVRPIAYTSLAVVIWWRVLMLVYYQVRRDRTQPHDAAAGGEPPSVS